MNDINTSNAIAQERARIREEVIRKSQEPGLKLVDAKGVTFVRITDVLSIIRNDQPRHEATP